MELEQRYYPVQLSHTHPKDARSVYHTGTNTPVLTVSLFTVARVHTHPGRPVTDGQTKKISGMYIKWNFIQPLKEK